LQQEFSAAHFFVAKTPGRLVRIRLIAIFTQSGRSVRFGPEQTVCHA
jgi:hypothetical protein